MSSPAINLGQHADIVAMEQRRRVYSLLTVLIVAAILAGGYTQAETMNSGGFVRGMMQFLDYPGDIVEEAWASGWAFWGIAWGFMPALIETLNIAATATILGGLLAMVFAFLSTRNLDVWPPLIPVSRRLMDVMRAFPELILALFLIFVLGASSVPAMIAIAVHTIGALGKLFSEVNENVDRRPIEGLQAVGAGWLQRMRFGVLPQVLPNYTSYFLMRFEINVRASAILGFVGAGGLGAELRRTIGWGSGEETAALLLLLFASIMVIDQFSGVVRRSLVSGTLLTQRTVA
ncbi:phosphonate ABC transporter, permease protein PhnE [Roseospira navarrensis]|uniref:Phosphonate ABC transporter, permease protein PhnE n=1 Tax=Roseospira navarrensis TaxID=140058 RepID=A0A7X1ZEZ9_9PROT|nr:phosphonate ABC transporter, permease protein PhnE [Roseospira navarrensis]MQX36361.1 phosphonate ABC transporter, permease protein PhnE [Roseospira navarrensis]